MLLALSACCPLRKRNLMELTWNVEGTGPVSYTHLRAHETVLDLVCRLLLEKKTTPQKSQLI